MFRDTCNKKLLGAPGIATRSKDATGAPGRTTRSILTTRSKDAERRWMHRDTPAHLHCESFLERPQRGDLGGAHEGGAEAATGDGEPVEPTLEAAVIQDDGNGLKLSL